MERGGRSGLVRPAYQPPVYAGGRPSPLSRQEWVLGHSLRRAAGPMKTTVVRAATALAPALALWLASAESSTRAYAWGWQSAVAEPLMSWAAGSARRRWRSRAPFAPGSP